MHLLIAKLVLAVSLAVSSLLNASVAAHPAHAASASRPMPVDAPVVHP